MLQFLDVLVVSSDSSAHVKIERSSSFRLTLSIGNATSIDAEGIMIKSFWSLININLVDDIEQYSIICFSSYNFSLDKHTVDNNGVS